MTTLALTGDAQSGKSTVSDYLVEHHGFTAYALGDKLKENAYAGDYLVLNEHGHAEHVRAVVDRLGWDEAKQLPEVRRLLQHVGSDAGWMFHGERLWTQFVEDQIIELRRAQPGAPVVISDLRMPHEARWLRDTYDRPSIIEIVRPKHATSLTGEQAAHVSEQRNFTVNQRIENTGTRDELYAAVDALLMASHPQLR